jgi:hypothetical protein
VKHTIYFSDETGALAVLETEDELEALFARTRLRDKVLDFSAINGCTYTMVQTEHSYDEDGAVTMMIHLGCLSQEGRPFQLEEMPPFKDSGYRTQYVDRGEDAGR